MKGFFYNLPEGCTYSTIFASKINPLVSSERDKYLALASQDQYKKYLPKNINFEEKVDFLGIAGESFIANKLNLNSDGVKSKEAIRIAKLFPLSFIDVNHDRTSVVGVILNTSYTEFGSGRELTEEEVTSMTAPFVVTIGGIVWKVVNPELSDMVEESSNPSSKFKDSVYFSWELAFVDYDLILIDKEKTNFEDGVIISDAEEIDKIEKEMKTINGTSFAANGKKVGRIPVGDKLIPLGIGFVNNPAGQVAPIVTNASIQDIDNEKDLAKKCKAMTCPECGEEVEMEDDEEEDEMDDEKEVECAKCKKSSAKKNWKKGIDKEEEDESGEIEANKKKNENNLSQNREKIVNDNDTKKDFMKLTKIQDLTDEHLKECKAADVTSLYDSEIKRIGEEYQAKLTEKEDATKVASAKVEELTKAQEAIQANLQKITEDYNKLIEANKQKEQVELFSARMQTLEDSFELTDEEKNILAEDIKACDTEESFAKFLKKQEILLAAKKKIPHTGKEDCSCGKCKTKMKQSKASENVDGQAAIDEALKNAEKAKNAIANAGSAAEPTQAEKAKLAFGLEGWVVENKRKERMIKD